MDRRIAGSSFVAGCLVAVACFTTTGCRRDGGVGETVPSPPRELIEKSYQGGQAPAQQPATGQPRGTAPGPR
jgi:hypothetical protein